MSVLLRVYHKYRYAVPTCSTPWTTNYVKKRNRYAFAVSLLLSCVVSHGVLLLFWLALFIRGSHAKHIQERPVVAGMLERAH